MNDFNGIEHEIKAFEREKAASLAQTDTYRSKIERDLILGDLGKSIDDNINNKPRSTIFSRFLHKFKFIIYKITRAL